MERLGEVSLVEKQPDAVDEEAGEGLVIPFGVGVHAAHGLIVSPDEAWQVRLEVDLWPFEQQVGGCGKVGFVGPFRARQSTREEAFADALDLGVRAKESWAKLGHRSGPRGRPERRRALG